MHLSLNWLNDYLKIPGTLSAAHLQELISTSIAEVEQVRVLGREGIIIAKVLDVQPHPNADRLKLVKVKTGKQEVMVVCGGSNVVAGMLVVFAQLGSQVKWHGEGELITLEKATIRGVESTGMICASSEVDLPLPCGEKEITDLTPYVSEKDIGRNVYNVLDLRDVIFEVDNKSLTNRPDLFGHYGFARDLAAVLHTQEKIASPLLPYPAEKLTYAKQKLDIRLTSKNCRRYSALRVKNIRVEESPLWLKKRLERGGVRPINTLVDITNYVMLDLGQPMHAFDSSKLAGGKIVIRQATAGESILALDGKTYKLDEQDMVIADGEKPVAIAGIMGGEDFSIGAATTEIILEAANFDPVAVRKTSQRLGVRSDSSTRFEKNLDPEYTLLALNRAVMLLQNIYPAAEISSALFDQYPVKIKPKTITLRPARILQKVGITVPGPLVKSILKELGCKVVTSAKHSLKVTVPSWRATKDLMLEDDLLEEVARVYGYRHIPLLSPVSSSLTLAQNTKKFERRVKQLMVERLGFFEVLNYPFTNAAEQEKYGVSEEPLVALKNPLSSEQTHLKSSLVPNLLAQAKENIHRLNQFALCEFGRVYREEKETVAEDRRLGAILVEPLQKGSAAENLFFAAKQQLEILFESLLLPARTYVKGPQYSFLAAGSSASILINSVPVGYLALIKKELKPAWDLEQHEIVVLELQMQQLETMAQAYTLYTTLPKFPVVVRDFAFVVPAEVTNDQMRAAIGEASPYIQEVALFDLYTGEQLGQDRKSLAYQVTYRNPQKTLTEGEIEEIGQHIVVRVKNLGATLRS